MSTLGLAVLLINRSAGPPSLMTQRVVTNAFGDGTYTVWVSSCGLSACSGNTGCGGSPIGTQPRDLLMAWLSFLAGDFYGEGGRKQKRPSPRVGIVGNSFESSLQMQIYITGSTACLLCQKCANSVSACVGCFTEIQCKESIILCSCHLKSLLC